MVPYGWGVRVTMVVRVSLVKVMVRTASGAALRTWAVAMSMVISVATLGMQRIESQLEFDAIDETVWHRIVFVG